MWTLLTKRPDKVAHLFPQERALDCNPAVTVYNSILFLCLYYIDRIHDKVVRLLKSCCFIVNVDNPAGSTSPGLMKMTTTTMTIHLTQNAAYQVIFATSLKMVCVQSSKVAGYFLNS